MEGRKAEQEGLTAQQGRVDMFWGRMAIYNAVFDNKPSVHTRFRHCRSCRAA